MVATCMERRGRRSTVDRLFSVCISIPYSCLFLRFTTLRSGCRETKEVGHLSVLWYH